MYSTNYNHAGEYLVRYWATFGDVNKLVSKDRYFTLILRHLVVVEVPVNPNYPQFRNELTNLTIQEESTFNYYLPRSYDEDDNDTVSTSII